MSSEIEQERPNAQDLIFKHESQSAAPVAAAVRLYLIREKQQIEVKNKLHDEATHTQIKFQKAPNSIALLEAPE